MKKVIIVGGGVAGLTAGKRLVDSGKFSVKLLEGDSRVGGRVHTIPLGDYFVENGAQWVHGEDGNSIYNLANSFKLLEKGEGFKLQVKSDAVYVTNTGRIIDKNIQEKITVVIDDILDGPEENETEDSVGVWAKQKFQTAVDKTPLSTNPDDKKWLNASVLDWAHRFQCNIDGTDNWFQTSLFGQHEYWECEGNPTIAWEPPASYSSILSVILNNSPTLAPIFQPELPSWVELEKDVTKIEILDAENEQIRVSCSDDSTYTCDIILCTVSLGVLKHRHRTMFHPSLPERKIRAIENLGIGCVNKLHFGFRTQWWPESVLGFNFLWDDADSITPYWKSDVDEATLKTEIGGFPLWCRNILGFYRLPAHPNALNSWITGPAARFIETMSDDEVKNMFMKICRKFLKDYDIPEPVEFCRSSWFSNPFTKGSYSFRQMDSEKNNVWAKDLAEPILDKSHTPIICFAGEATHDHYYSTVHGAFESGVREAGRLINLPN